MPRSPEPPPLQSTESTEALYSRVIARGRRLRRERRAFVLTAGMSLLLLAAAIPVALTNDDPAQLATTGPTTTRRPSTTAAPPLDALEDPNAATTTTPETTAPIAVEGNPTTTARTTRTTARRSSATTARPPTTKQSGPAPTPAPSPTSTSTTVIPASPAASPCGGEQSVLAEHGLAFVRGGDIWMIPPTGGDPVQVTTTGDASKPAWKPDGTQLVFARPVGLFTAPPIASAPTTQVTGTEGDTEPAWSPDGGRIAFVRGGDIFAMPANGSTPAARVRGEDAALGSPAWSNDSCDLAFTWKTWVLKARSRDGTGVTGVSNGVREPSWAANGRLAVTAAEGIRVINPNGTGEVRLGGTVGARVPSWRASATELAFQAADGIRTVPADGSAAPVLVTGTAAGDTDPAW